MESRNVAPGFEQTSRPKQPLPQQRDETGSSPRIRPEIPEQEQQPQKIESKFPPHLQRKVARPHRCNDRLEDVIQVLREFHCLRFAVLLLPQLLDV